MPRSWPTWIARAARTANRILSWLPNRIAEDLAYHVARGLLGCSDVTHAIPAALIEDFQAHLGVRIAPVRFIRLSDRAARLLKGFCGRFVAVTWVGTVYLSAGLSAAGEQDPFYDRSTVDTVVHELWHVHQFWHSGGGLYWIGRWLWERLRYGLREMPIEVEARRVAREFSSREQ